MSLQIWVFLALLKGNNVFEKDHKLNILYICIIMMLQEKLIYSHLQLKRFQIILFTLCP